MQTLVIYFSMSGNTERIALKLQQELGADIEKLETATPYPKAYREMEAQGHSEVNKGFKPALKPLKHNLSNYDRIIIGTPTWWYKMAPAVLTFITTNNLEGKTIVAYMTNAGWPGTVIKDMKNATTKSGAKVVNTKEFVFDTNSDGTTTGMATPEKELDEWISSIK